jgi:hypothetical protein
MWTTEKRSKSSEGAFGTRLLPGLAEVSFFTAGQQKITAGPQNIKNGEI